MKQTKTENSKRTNTKSGKAMTTENSKFSESCEDTDEMLISVQESRDKYVKDLQQENARLRQELKEIIPWLDKHSPIMSSRTRKEFKSFINQALKGEKR